MCHHTFVPHAHPINARHSFAGVKVVRVTAAAQGEVQLQPTGEDIIGWSRVRFILSRVQGTGNDQYNISQDEVQVPPTGDNVMELVAGMKSIFDGLFVWWVQGIGNSMTRSARYS